MALELIKDTIKFDQIVGEGQSQTLVDKDIIVPDIKPDIARILSVEGKVNITGKNVEQDRVSVDGNVNFAILYSAGDEAQPIYSMNYIDSFSQYIDIPGTMPRMDANVKCFIEHIDYNRINGRKLNIQCVIKIKGNVIDRIPVDVVRDAGGLDDIQLLKDAVVIDETIGENTAQEVVRATIQIPPSIPQADEILKYRAFIHKKEAGIEEGKINISGSLLVPVLFSSKLDKSDIYKVEEDILFTHTMDMPGITPEMNCGVDYTVDDIFAELKENEDGERRQIDVEIVVGLKARVCQRNEYPVVVDMYAPSVRIEPEKLDLNMDLLFGRNSSQAAIRESLQLPDDYPEIEKIYDMVCRPMVTDCKALEEKVVVEGVVGCDIIYLARGEDRLVYSFSDEVPFKTSVSIPGCNIDMKPEVEIDIESMDFSMLTRGEVEVKIVLGCLAKIYKKISKEFIVKAEEGEGEVPIHKASITIYMVQPKDTLWKIAKRYCTTVEDIVRVNDIANPDNITPGMKLIIPKRI